MTQLIVTDHALLRYLERVKGMPVQQYRDEIKAMIAVGSDNPVPTAPGEGFLFVLDMDAVLTVMGPFIRPRARRVPTQRFVYVPLIEPAEAVP